MKTLTIVKKEYQRVGYDENDIEPIEYVEVKASYNENGQILQEERFDADGMLNTLTINAYNENKLLSQTEQFDQDHILLQKSVYHYNEKQLLVKQGNFFGEDDNEYITQYVYDDEDHLIRIEMYADGELDFIEKEMTYENGVLVKEVENDDYGNTVNIHYYTYGDKGLLIKHVRDEIQNKDRRTYEYTYNDQGNCIKELVYDYGNALISKIYRQYNEHGKLIETEEEDLDNYRKITMEYDQDLVVKNSLLNKEGNLLGWAEYTYDDQHKENSSKEFIQDEIQPEHFRLLRETRYERE